MWHGLGVLNLRQKEVAAFVAKGQSNKEIGDHLHITEKTVKFHLTTIYKKTGVSSRAQLIVAMLKDYPTSTEIDQLLYTLGYS